MIFLTYCVLLYGGLLAFPGVYVSIVGMFVSLMWTGRFTGAYLNPALTIACMIKKERKVPAIKAIFYVFAQFLGAIVGTFFAWAVKDGLPAPFEAEFQINTVAEVFGKEVIGTFIYCLIVMIMISSDTTFLELEIQIWLSTPLILVTVCEMTRLPLGCNPAWSLAYQLVWGIHKE